MLGGVGSTRAAAAAPAAQGTLNPIKVVCRVRGKERTSPHGRSSPARVGQGGPERIHVDPAGGVVRLDCSEMRAKVGAVRGGSGGADGQPIRDYELDGVFDSQASQFDVYKTVGIPAVSSLLKGGGRTVTIISCGAEGTGKSYTLCGPCDGVESHLSLRDDNRGLLLRMVDSIFNRLNQAGLAGGLAIDVSHIIITPDDAVLDLLQDVSPDGGEWAGAVELRQVAQPDEGSLPPSLQWQGVLGGCTAVRVTAKEDAVAVLDAGLRKAGKQRGDRAVCLRIIWRPRGADEQHSHLILTDCAPVYTKSVHNLRDVVSYLSLNHAAGRAAVPYGKSKLTRLLQGDLCLSSGNATRIIVHIKLSNLDLDVFDSASILHFATMARKVQRCHISPEQALAAEAAAAAAVTVPRGRRGSAGGVAGAAIGSTPPVSSRSSTLPLRPAASGLPSRDSPLAPSPQQQQQQPAGRAAGRETPPERAVPGGPQPGAAQPPMRSPQQQLPPHPARHDAVISPRGGGTLSSASSRSSPATLSRRSPQSLPPTPQGSAAGSGASSGQMLASYLQSLTVQLREKEDQYRQAMDELEHYAGLLQRERERSHASSQRNTEQERRLRELELVTRSKADHFVCFRCNTNPYAARALAQATGEGDDDDGEGPLAVPVGAPTGLLLPLPRDEYGSDRSPPGARTGSPSPLAHVRGDGGSVRGGSRSPAHLGRCKSPENVHYDASAATFAAVSDSSSSGEAAPSLASGELDMHSLSSGENGSMCSDERASERLRAAQSAAPVAVQALLRRLDAYRDRYRRTRGRLRKALKAHAYERERVQDLNAQFEEAERQKQELIAKCIAASSRLEESKRWMRRIKKSLQQEKENKLDQVNDQWKKQVAALQRGRRDGGSEDADIASGENATLRETVQSLKTMVGHLSAEYNRRVADLLARARDGRPLSEDPEAEARSRTAPPEDLRLDNEALRANVAALMKALENSYADNSHLSSLSNRLSARLGEANDRILALEADWDGARTPGRVPRVTSGGSLSPDGSPRLTPARGRLLPVGGAAGTPRPSSADGPGSAPRQPPQSHPAGTPGRRDDRVPPPRRF